MSVGALRRRLARLDGNGAATPCPGRCGAMRFVLYDEYDRPIDPPGRCEVCGGPFLLQYHIRPLDPKPLPPGAPPVGPRCPVAGTGATGVAEPARG